MLICLVFLVSLSFFFFFGGREGGDVFLFVVFVFKNCFVLLECFSSFFLVVVVVVRGIFVSTFGFVVFLFNRPVIENKFPPKNMCFYGKRSFFNGFPFFPRMVFRF